MGDSCSGLGGIVKYRSDVDGLRAVAVTSVVAYHLQTPQVTGGFVGVDVFFVISGFLITSLIVGELGEGRFTITDFYRRRLRRIVPALATVLLVTCLVASVLLFADELTSLSRSAIWAGLFSSNIYFWANTGYFDTPATSQPLLHTWSLGVEEQFYVVFPLLLVLVHRWRLRLVLAAVTLVSFLLSVAQVRSGHVEAAFYLLPGRAWELGVGALLAVTTVRAPAIARHAGSLLGLALIGWACHHYTSTTPFPGTAALAPVLGAGLLIAAGRDAVVNRALSWRPVVGIGLVSYSWYLWHWPAIVIYRLYTFNGMTWTSRLALAGGTLALAVLSWRFVERPLRRLRLPQRRHVLAFAAATSAAVVVLGLVVQPLSRQVHPADAVTAGYLREAGVVHATANRDRSCFIATGFNLSNFNPVRCTTPRTGVPNVLVFGDSHAADLWKGLSIGLPRADVLQATASGCKPTLPLSGQSRCVAVLSQELTRLRTQHVDVLVVSARWKAGDVAGLADSIRQYQRLVPTVVVVGPSPEWFGNLPSLLARARDTGDAGLPGRHLDQGIFRVDQALRAAVLAQGGLYVSLLDELCPARHCRELAGGTTPMAFDYGHFTAAGSAVAAADIVALVGPRLSSGAPN
ncbi:MAG: hypothetical protein JWL79_630 [Frankiales bacterium]|nr:hypothetical protein [Frankiales bacterium]